MALIYTIIVPNVGLTLLWVYQGFTKGFPLWRARTMACVVPSLVTAQTSYQYGTTDMSGAITIAVICFFVGASNLCFLVSIKFANYMTSKVIRYRDNVLKEHRAKVKQRIVEEWQQMDDMVKQVVGVDTFYTMFLRKQGRSDDEEDEEHNINKMPWDWQYVMCTWGVALEFALLYLLILGPSDRMIDFQTDYTRSWFAMATFGALCCTCGDTCSSQIGTIVGVGTESTLITSLKKVPRGTNGGVSQIGMAASVIGGMLVGGAYCVGLLICAIRSDTAPPQWLLIPLGGVFGLLGSTIDSIIGATLQYSGYDKKRLKLVDHPQPEVEHVAGRYILDNHTVNMVSCLVTGLAAPWITSTVYALLF